MSKNFFNLTSPQKSIWYTEEYLSGTNIGNICGTLVFKESVNFKKLEQARDLNTFLNLKSLHPYSRNSFNVKLCIIFFRTFLNSLFSILSSISINNFIYRHFPKSPIISIFQKNFILFFYPKTYEFIKSTFSYSL